MMRTWVIAALPVFLLSLGVPRGAAAANAEPAATDYPARPVRLLVPNPPGGGTDLVARIVSQKVSETWPVSIVVDNRAGAGGILAVETAARATPDGHTLLLAHFPLAITVNLVKVSFDPVRDFAPVTLLATTQNVLLVNASVPAQTVKELIALAKAKPGELRYASGGNGTSMHVSAELFAMMAGVKLAHVPYKGAAPALVGLMNGEVQASFVSAPAAAPQVKAGKVRALAVTGSRRSPALPDLPTLSEAGLPGYGSEQWYGILVPRRTPAPVVAALNRDFAAALRDPATRSRLTASGYEVAADTTARWFGDFLKKEIAKWGTVVKQAGIRAQ